MKYEYLRIDVLSIINLSAGHDRSYFDDLNWFQTQADTEWRPDYQCFFVLKGSPTHTMIAMKYGDIFDK